MSDRRIVHEVKFSRSVTVILAALVLGVILNALGPEQFGIREALAELNGGGYQTSPFYVQFTCHGCN